MAIPAFENFLFPFLSQLKDKDVSSKEMKDALVLHFGLTEEDRLLRTKGGSAYQIDDRIGWVRQWLQEDTLGLDKIYIQAKRYTDNPVGKPEIQQFVGALNEQKASKGVFVTTSTFTKGAIESVNKATSKIVLIDGKALAKYMIEYNVGVSTKKVYAIKKIDTDYFEE